MPAELGTTNSNDGLSEFLLLPLALLLVLGAIVLGGAVAQFVAPVFSVNGGGGCVAFGFGRKYLWYRCCCSELWVEQVSAGGGEERVIELRIKRILARAAHSSDWLFKMTVNYDYTSHLYHA